MVVNIVAILVLLGLTILFGYLAVRSWRSSRPVTRWLGGIITSLLALVFLAVTVVVSLGVYRMNVPAYIYTKSDIQVKASPEMLSRGEKIVALCADCHSTTGNVPADGSKDNFAAGGPPVGVLYAPNLTPGGPLKDWTDGEIIRAIREGVDKNGRPLIIMPSQAFHSMSDQDVQSVVAFLRSQPAVNRQLPERDLNPIAAVFLGLGMFPTSAQPPITGPIAHPQVGTVEYGKYIVAAFGCPDCHGPNLSGSSGGNGGPAGPALAGVISSWKEEDLLRVFHEGVDPTGHKLSDEMPWKKYGAGFSDDELKSLYLYLSSLPSQTASNK